MVGLVIVILNLFCFFANGNGGFSNSSHKKPFQNKTKVSKRQDPEFCQSEGPHVNPIIIVGAGAAGLTAAATLIEVGCDVLVLEAQDHIGGRAFSFNTASSFSGVDGGAHYVLGGEDNTIISSLLATLGLTMEEVGGDEVYFFSERSSLEMWLSGDSGTWLNSDERDLSFDLESIFQSTLRMWWEQWKSESVGTDVSIAHGLDETFASFTNWSAFAIATTAWHHYLKFNYNKGAEPAVLSLRDFMDTNYTSFYKNDSSNNAIIPGGFQVIWDKLVNTTNMVVETSTPVVTISNSHHGVVVTVANGSEFEGSGVIVTVPLGVLLGNGITFEPPIEELKFGNMSTLGIAHVATVILRYNNNSFMSSGHHGLGYISSNEWIYISHSEYDITSPAFETFYLTEAAAKEIENVDLSILSNKYAWILNEMYDTDAFSHPDDVYVSNWNTNNFFNGTSSYVPVGASSTARDVYAEPSLDGRVMFAGEATCATMPGTVHGAIASGFREVLRILESFETIPWHPSTNIPCHHPF